MVRGWYVERQQRTAPTQVFRRGAATELPHKTIDSAESEAGALFFLCGKERLEYAGEHVHRNACARVRYRDRHVRLRGIRHLACVRCSRRDVARLNRNDASVRRGVPRVNGHIDDCELQLLRIGHHVADVGSHFALQLDRLRQGMPCKIANHRQRFPHVDARTRERPFAGEREQLLDKTASTGYCTLHCSQWARQISALRQQRDDSCVCGDDVEQIIKVVREASSQFRQSLVLFELPQLI